MNEWICWRLIEDLLWVFYLSLSTYSHFSIIMSIRLPDSTLGFPLSLENTVYTQRHFPLLLNILSSDPYHSTKTILVRDILFTESNACFLALISLICFTLWVLLSSWNFSALTSYYYRYLCKQWLWTGGSFALQGYLVMSGDIFGHHNWEGAAATGIWWVEARVAVKHSTMYRTGPHTYSQE